jgi:hypothetical protein
MAQHCITVASSQWQATDFYSVHEQHEQTATSSSNQRRRMTLPTENHILKDTNSWIIHPANFNVYTNILVYYYK